MIAVNRLVWLMLHYYAETPDLSVRRFCVTWQAEAYPTLISEASDFFVLFHFFGRGGDDAAQLAKRHKSGILLLAQNVLAL